MTSPRISKSADVLDLVLTGDKDATPALDCHTPVR
jgi:hypothetical protein